MKIRNGFVSNSSSSSFTLIKKKLSRLQRIMIEDHIKFGEEMGMYPCEEEDAWSVYDNGEYIELYTSLNNFDMEEFLEKIGVDEKAHKDWMIY